MNTVQPTSITLESVKQQFENWRSQRGKMGSFPDELWRKAVALLDSYDSSDVIRELRVTKQQLNDRAMRYSSVGLENEFVGLSVTNDISQKQVISATVTNSSMTNSQDTTSSGIELKKPDGTSLVIHNLPMSNINDLVATFMG